LGCQSPPAKVRISRRPTPFLLWFLRAFSFRKMAWHRSLDEFDKGRIEAIFTKDSDLNYFQIRVKYPGRSQET
jgi:hypothetical protein